MMSPPMSAPTIVAIATMTAAMMAAVPSQVSRNDFLVLMGGGEMLTTAPW
jgi:hypothetical protein